MLFIFNKMRLLNILLLLQQLVNGHIFMSDPPSRRNKYSPMYVSQGNVDYNIMAPLLWDGVTYTFPCKGFPKGPSTKTINGNIVSITLEGSATHGGGHCQFGITYDNKEFVVLRTVISDCLLTGMTYNIELPSNIPSGEVTIFWTWINRIGNREYYMECADILINNSNSSKSDIQISGKELLIANYPGYPIIPEGLPPGNDGINLLNTRKDISIISGECKTRQKHLQQSQPQPQPQSQPQSQPQPQPQPQPQSQLQSLTTSKATYYFRVGDDKPGCPSVQTFSDGNIYGPCNAKYGSESKYWAAIADSDKHCGKKIIVSYGNRNLILTVMDSCSVCSADNHVDMSLDALIELTGSVNAACAINTVLPEIKWSFL